MLGDSASDLIEQFGSETFKAVHDSDQDGLIYFTGDGRIEYMNRAAKELFGVTNAVIGDNILDHRETEFTDLPVEIIHPSNHFEKARETYKSGVPARSELVIVDDDDRHEIEVVWGPVEQAGDVVGVVGSYRDISPRPDIHDQLAAEATQLEEQRRFLASIIDVLDDGILVFAGDGTLALANPSATEMLGLDPPLEGLKLGEFLDRTDLHDGERFADQLRRTAGSDESTTGIHFADRPDDGPRRLELTIAPSGVEHSHIVCTISDTTQRLEVEQMKLLSQIGAFSTDPGDIATLADRIVDAIVEALEVDFAVLTHFSESRLQPLAWRGVMIDDDMTIDLDQHPTVERILETASPQRIDEWRWQFGDEDEIGQIVVPLFSSEDRLGTLHLGHHASFGTSPFSSALDALDVAFTEALGNYIAGALENAMLVERSTTKQKRLESIIETLPQGVMLYTRRGDVLMVNSAAAELTEVDNWTNLNTTARPYRLLDLDRNPLGRSEWPFFRAVRTHAHCHDEVIFDFGHTERDVLLDAAPIDEEADDPTIFVGIFRDITEQRRLDRRKDEFLSIASHELRSPMTPLTGVLQLARRQAERGGEVDLSLLTRAERQVSRLTRLIDGLLDLTRIETGRIDLDLQRVEFTEFVKNRVRPWQHNPKDIDIELTVPDARIEAIIDPDRINQVITNVVDNAIKYSKADEVICIDVDDHGETVSLAIEDDGVGMDQETVSHIFDRFFHGHDAGGGPRSMGLGLYICRQIIEQHDGEITVDSEKGVGTRVEIELPKTP